MRTEISRAYTFEAAHRLPHVPAEHKCARMHGHSFRITLVVAGEIDPVFGWVVDFADLDEAWQPLFKILDHQVLNDIEGLENPTSELLGHWIAARFKFTKAKLNKVIVHETCASACTVYLD